MASERYLPFLPIVLNWIQQTLDAHAREKRAVTSFKFPRLPQYFSEELLNSASVVITDRLPRPPLSALGLTEFADFEKQPMGGITYQDTYFVKTSAATVESLHFHELVHVVQWRVLGPQDFLLLYAAGLAQYGYGIEIDPKYCDVICQRWSNITSQQPTLEGDGRTFDAIRSERLAPSSPW